MYSHVMVGSNDPERSKKFYDSLFEKEGRTDDKGRTAYGRKGSVFMISRPIDGQPATHSNGGTIGFGFDTPEEVDAWHQRGIAAGGTAIEDPPGYRENAFGKLYLAYLRDPDGNKLCGLYRPPAMTLETVSEVRSHGGVQGVYKHASSSTGTEMTFSVFVPPQAERGEPLPVLWYLSGLTCTHANVTEKGEYRAACAEAGIIFVAPDTSPRGDGVPDDPDGAWDFGLGAGFYVDATETPWSRHYRMESYIIDEMPALLADHFPIDPLRQSISGHSMGGHGALTLALKNPGRFRSVSAFAPIVAPSQVPWGEKAFSNYLGSDRASWAAYDSVALIEGGARVSELLVDVGEGDPFLDRELRPQMLKAACANAGIPLTLRQHPAYDHSYYFISTFMADHVRWHSERLQG